MSAMTVLALAAGSAGAEVWYSYRGSQGGASRVSLASAIPAPEGYERIPLRRNSFPDWVRHLPVRPEGTEVRTWDGRRAPQGFYAVWRVIDLPLLFRQDLEQCADWGFRFWHDYQAEAGFADRLWLTDYNGVKRTWGAWKAGKPGAAPREFFRWACANANSYSQKRGLSPVTEEELRPGDLLVQNETGGVGHTSIVFDVAAGPAGKRAYLMGFGFMPAQEAHIEKAGPARGTAGWFTLEGYYRFLDEHLPFGRPVLRSFEPRRPLALSGDALADWDAYEKAVRDSTIAVEEAGACLPRVVGGLEAAFGKAGPASTGLWAFPVEGYGLAAVGGRDGSDFAPGVRYGESPIKGYSFFDGNRHGGHPGHDIFIADRDQDSLDDARRRPAAALAMLPGVVVSTCSGWRAGSLLRGGNYVWVFHPAERLFSYYAHLGEVRVEPGQRVAAGSALGTVARTGFSAARPRSPTHLHLMVLEYRDGDLVPLEYYGRLRR